ncbi:hypothetical protein GCM10009548_93980 [Streptomyces malaysiensis subsp. malaysiensis]
MVHGSAALRLAAHTSEGRNRQTAGSRPALNEGGDIALHSRAHAGRSGRFLGLASDTTILIRTL